MNEYWIVSILIAAIVIALHFWLRGRSHHAFDQLDAAHVQRFVGRDPSHPAQLALIQRFNGLAPLLKLPMREQIPALRDYMNVMFSDRPHTAEFLPVDSGGVRGEWVLAPGADPARRTLYIHGGAFTMGSPLSHRTLTTRFSELSGGAVFALDYRLMPEHPRQAGIDDCRAAYRWLLDNGPGGSTSPVQTLFVAGDSAGGNLTLSTIAWARDAGLRKADAAVALSPFTDASLASPSLKGNMATDPMLGPMLKWMGWVPSFFKPFVGWVMSQNRPSHPAISPLHGDLANLPPLLIQASECEMLHDDGRRYVAKAIAAGTPARLQTWSHMVHVWQVFPDLDEGREALDEIGRFLTKATVR